MWVCSVLRGESGCVRVRDVIGQEALMWVRMVLVSGGGDKGCGTTVGREVRRCVVKWGPGGG